LVNVRLTEFVTATVAVHRGSVPPDGQLLPVLADTTEFAIVRSPVDGELIVTV
jgi:hypothetical protein